MATGPNKDVKLTLSVETLGTADIKALQTAIKTLATDGSSAAPEFQRLADQIDRLGNQNEALQSFKSLSDEVDQLAARQADAAARVAKLSTDLAEQSQSVARAKEALQDANEKLLEGQRAYASAGAAIKAYKAETDAATKDTAAYREELKRLVQVQADEQASLLGLRAARREANSEVSAAVSAQSKLETAYNSASNQANRLEKSLRDQQTALAEAGRAAETLGVSTTDLASAEARLISAFNETGAAAARRAEQSKEIAEADRLLAIQEKTLAALYAESQRELQAMTLAQVDATASVRSYEQAREKAAAAERAAAEATEKRRLELIEIAEADRLLAIQQQGLNDLLRRGADALQAEQAAIREAAQASNLYAVEKRQQADAEKAAADAAQAAADRIENAFRATGVRSVEALKTEINELRTAMEVLRGQSAATGQSFSGAFAQGEAKIKALERDIRELNGTLTTGDRIAGLFKNSMGQIAAGNLVADGIGYIINKVKELASAFVETIAKSEALTRALNAIYKDTQTTAAQIDFLRTTALSAGVAVGGIQQAFVKFSAATAASNIPLEQSNALFAALVRAGGTLGLSSEEVTGALEALGQMASKGVVSMEELRQQLGDRLPGALSLAAKGLGLTDAQLIKLVESGGLAARDLFPALTGALKSMEAEVTGITPAWETFKNVLSGVATDAGDAGWATILAGAIRALGGLVGGVALAFSTLYEGMRITTIAGLALFESLRGKGKEAFAFLSAEIDKTNLRLEKQQLRLTALISPSKEVTDRLNELSAKQSEQAATATLAAAGTDKLATATVSTAEGQKALQDALGVTAATYVKARTALDEQIAASEKQAETATKNVKAAQDEGNALVALAKLRGDERAELEASVRAKEQELIAQQKVAAAKQREADLLNVEKALLIDTAAARGLTQQALDAEVAKLDLKIGKAEAEAAQARGSLSVIQLETAARQVAAKTYGDQSAALTTLKDAAVSTQAAFIAVSQAFAEGRATADQVRAADIAAAQARAQYNDALRDSVDKIKAVSTVEQARINLQLSGLSVSQNAYNLLAQSSRASGDYAAAIYYEIEAKRVQIQITQLQAQAKKLEAEAELASIEATRKALESQGQLTEAKKLELEARTLNAKAKLVEAGASTDIIRALEAEVTAIRNRSNAVSSNTDVTRQGTAATQDSTSAIDRNTDSLNRNADASERAAEAERKRLNVDKDGFTKGKDGNRLVMGSDLATRTGIVNFLKSAGVDNEQVAMDIANRASDANGNVIYNNNPLQLANGGTTLSAALLKEAEKYTFGAKQQKPTNNTTNQGGKTYSVTVTLGGRSTTINTASDSDASALVSILRSLETASRTSS